MRVQKFWRQHRVPALTAVSILAVLVGILAVRPWLPQWLGDAPAEVLIIVGIAVFSTWIAIWRGRQAREQIQKTQEQVSEQILSNAIGMATDIENPPRVRAGFARLRDLYGGAEDEAGRASLRLAQRATGSIIKRGWLKGEEIDIQVREEASDFLDDFPLVKDGRADDVAG